MQFFWNVVTKNLISEDSKLLFYTGFGGFLSLHNWENTWNSPNSSPWF